MNITNSLHLCYIEPNVPFEFSLDAGTHHPAHIVCLSQTHWKKPQNSYFNHFRPSSFKPYLWSLNETRKKGTLHIYISKAVHFWWNQIWSEQHKIEFMSQHTHAYSMAMRKDMRANFLIQTHWNQMKFDLCFSLFEAQFFWIFDKFFANKFHLVFFITIQYERIETNFRILVLRSKLRVRKFFFVEHRTSVQIFNSFITHTHTHKTKNANKTIHMCSHQ